MAFQVYYTIVVTTIVIVATIVIMRRLSKASKASDTPGPLEITSSFSEPTALVKSLVSALPGNVILPHDCAAFRQSMSSYWAQQECEVTPACVVRPRNIYRLSTTVMILKQEFDKQRERLDQVGKEGLFAIRSGGHSPVSRAASINGGVLVELSLFDEVTPNEDESSVIIGTGAKWMDVSRTLDEKGLAVVGGRNSAVGVGGLTLGGGLSFFSPRFGLVCSNILSYEVVLASGAVVTASSFNNPDLWKALKGGSNKFGIVTRFTARSFPSTSIWSGFLYMLSFQAPKVLKAFHVFVNRVESNHQQETYDPYAAGPLACFSYIQAIGMQAISVNLVYTKLPENETRWPTCWSNSPFKSLWRFWSTCKVRTLTSATDEMNALDPPGRRQVFANVTIKNDLSTLTAAYAAYCDAISSLQHAKVKGLVWTLVLQPLLPRWARKGDVNPLGLDDGTHEPLVIVSFTVNWDERRDDRFVKETTHTTAEQIEAFATAHKTNHRYRYLNYCGDWQKPFVRYGDENLRFLQQVSRKYDPDGLF